MFEVEQVCVCGGGVALWFKLLISEYRCKQFVHVSQSRQEN